MRTKCLLMNLFLVLLMVVCTGCASKRKTWSVEAKVLSINHKILKGELRGRFLGSSDGHISNDVMKVGVSFEIEGHLFLTDLELNHAEVAYYDNKKTLPLDIEINNYYLVIRLNGRSFDSIYLGWKLTKKLRSSKKVI